MTFPAAGAAKATGLIVTGAGGVALSDHLFTLAGILLTAAGGIALALAPQIYRDTKLRKSRKKILNDPATGEEQAALIDHLRGELETVTASRDRHLQENRELRDELEAVRDDKHGMATDLTVERGMTMLLRQEVTRLREQVRGLGANPL